MSIAKSHAILSFFMALILTLSITPLSAAEIIYRVGVRPADAPFCYYDKSLEDYTGFDIELLKAIAKNGDFKLQFIKAPFKDFFHGVRNNALDIAVSGISITEKRKRIISFTDPYYTSGISIIKRSNDDSITSPSDLSSKRVGFEKGTTAEPLAIELNIKGLIGAIIPIKHLKEGAELVAKGRIEAIIKDTLFATSVIKEFDGQLAIIDKPLREEDYGFVVSKKNTKLLSILNKGLKKLVKNGTYQKLKDKYLIPK